MGGTGGGFSGTCIKHTGQNQRGGESRVGGGDGWGEGSGGEKMETPVLEQQLKKKREKNILEAENPNLQLIVIWRSYLTTEFK